MLIDTFIKGRSMDRKKLIRNLADIGKDILVAFAVVALVMLALFAYCGIWPPMVVVESGSMQRFDDRSAVGIIDTGDMVFVKKVNGIDDVLTYVEGENGGYAQRYGTYGDVIIYRPNGLTERADGTEVVPIIHRLVVWLEVNDTLVNPAFDGIDYQNYTFDVPSLGLYNTTEDIVLLNYGYWRENVTIELGLAGGLLRYYEYLNAVPHGGYITMGDHNVPAYDQPLSGAYEPVLPEWIVGKAIGEMPWFGLVKLKVTGTNLDGVPGNSWTNLFITVFLILLVPFMFDILSPRAKKIWRERREKISDSGTEPVGGGGATPPTGRTDAPAGKEEDIAESPSVGELAPANPAEKAK